MLFSSTFFLLYFLPVFLTIYFIIPSRFKNLFTLIASILFFAWGAPKFVFVLSAAVIVDFFIAQLIHKNEGRKRKLFLAIGVVFNVSVLLYFKYFNFFMDNFNVLLNDFGLHSFSFTRVALPIGISFFVFHEMSYIIDVHRRVKPPMNNIINYGLYIFLFPQLIAGPIIRFNEIADQIQNRNFQDNIDNRLLGLFRFAIGLAKKVLIANVLGAEADQIFKLPYEELTALSSWVGALCYTFQIYFDFSGYSDMAIGLARTMGFIFPENFNNPYISQSITEFWRRWHMSLSRWMRDYLYISLGGNKVSVPRMYFNLCFVFLISGFWHGAQWTFIVWGAYHGLFLVLDRLFLIKLTSYIGKIPRIIFTFFVVIVGWIFFRSETIGQAFQFLKKMFSFSYKEYSLAPHLLTVFVAAIIFSFITPFLRIIKSELNENILPMSIGKAAFGVLTIVVFMIVCIGQITASGFNPFIYFKF
ncbi:MAG: MBOAT family protein [Bacteroidetes bacterium]|nr:MBOAT family protein [Bacteroidota bacterium]